MHSKHLYSELATKFVFKSIIVSRYDAKYDITAG